MQLGVSRRTITDDEGFLVCFSLLLFLGTSSKLDSRWKQKDKIGGGGLGGRRWHATCWRWRGRLSHYHSGRCFFTSVPWAARPLFTGAAEERGQAETRLPKCLHLFYRCCYIGLLQIKWLSKMLIKTSNNLHFVYSNLHNCTVTQYSAVLPWTDFHQLSAFIHLWCVDFDKHSWNCVCKAVEKKQFRDNSASMKANPVPLTVLLNDSTIYSYYSFFCTQ